MGYGLSKHSMSQLIGLHPELGFMVTEGIKITTQDFIAFEGIRTLAKQKRLKKKGVSKTLKSYHLYGLAIDCVAWQDGRASWQEGLYPAINKAFTQVIKTHGLSIQNGFDLWGWDMPHWQMSGFMKSYDIRKLNKDKIC